MITLEDDHLVFRSEVDPASKLTISFQRALRVPLDGPSYPLPATIGQFPVRHVEDYAHALPPETVKRQGVLIPMWQAEALWLKFSSSSSSSPVFPLALQVAAGKVNALTGEPLSSILTREPQNYMVVPDQRWLDGFVMDKDGTRQFVAMPLESKISSEELLTKSATWGGLEILVIPLRSDAWRQKRSDWAEHLAKRQAEEDEAASVAFMIRRSDTMGLAPGGFIHQKASPDFFELRDWDVTAASRVFITMVHAKMWEALTSEKPPSRPTKRTYKKHSLPWQEFYDSDDPSDLLSRLAFWR